MITYDTIGHYESHKDSILPDYSHLQFNPCLESNNRKIVDTDRQPVEGATVVMQLPDSTYLGAAISAADGTFSLEPMADRYLLIVQHLFYQSQVVKGQTRDAGIIVLEPKEHSLAEVVVEGERPLVTVEQGKLSYDISAISKSISSTMLTRLSASCREYRTGAASSH